MDVDKLQSFKQNEQRLQNQYLQLRGKADKQQMSLGSLQEEQNRHKKEVEECERFIKKSAEELNVTVPVIFEVSNVRSMVNKLKEALNECKASNQVLAKECDIEQDRLQGVVDQCREEVATVRHKILAQKQQIKDAQRKSRDLNSQLQDLDVADNQLQTLLSKITKIDRDLEQYKHSIDATALTRDVEKMKAQIAEDDSKMEQLESEFKVLNANCITEMEIENLQLEVRKRESETNKLKNKNFDNFNEIFEGKCNTSVWLE